MITLKNFNLSRLLSQLVAPVCLGRELQGSNVFLDFFGCVAGASLPGSFKSQPPTSKESRALIFQSQRSRLGALVFDDSLELGCLVLGA